MKKEKKLPTLLAYKAEKALKRAVAKAIAEHYRGGIPIAVWRDGKVVLLHPDQYMIRDVHVDYNKSSISIAPTHHRQRK
jgi:hypothetical protein